MNMDLSPKFPGQTLEDVEGGRYSGWASAESPVLREAKVAAGKLVLKPLGFALPHYGDCNKVGYVLEGNCEVGLICPANIKDKMAIISLKKGDIIPITKESVSWWYNNGDSDLVTIFLGDSSTAYVPGEFSYFFLAGPLGYLANFSPEFIAKTYPLDLEKAQKLGNSQKGVLLNKLSQQEADTMANPFELGDLLNVWTRNIDSASPDVEVKNGGESTTLTPTEFPLLEEVGLNVTRLVLEANASRAPSYASAAQIFYVAKGNGNVEIVGLQGKQLVFNTKVENGQVFVVPKLLMVSISADADGMELISIITSNRPVTGELAGKDSVLNRIPSILQLSLNVSPELKHDFKRNMESGTTIVPPNPINLQKFEIRQKL